MTRITIIIGGSHEHIEMSRDFPDRPSGPDDLQIYRESHRMLRDALEALRGPAIIADGLNDERDGF